MKGFLTILCCIVLSVSAHAQEAGDTRLLQFRDSIAQVLKNTKTDTAKLKVYFHTCVELQKELKYGQVLEYAYKAAAFADSVKCSGNATACRIRLLISAVYNDRISDIAEALEQEKKVKSIADSIKDSALLAEVLTSMGLTETYIVRDTFATGIKYYNRALLISRKTHNTEQIIHILALIGNLYLFKKDTDIAVKYYRDCILIGLENHSENHAIAASFNNLGELYMDAGKEDSAMKYFREAERLANSADYTSMMAVVLQNIGNIYVKHKNTLTNGIDTLLLAAKTGMKGNNPHYSSLIAFDLYSLFKAHGDLKNALYWKEKSDSLVSLMSNSEWEQRIISTRIEASVQQEKERDQLIQEKKDAVASETIKRQQFIRNTLIAAFLLAVLFVFYLFNRFRLIRSQKILIENQKHEVDRAYKIVEQKNDDVLASIRYASRIQNALLVPEESMGRFFPEHFILYMPRDIVSGDFYWIAQVDQKIYMATADCTGHGVPGAFMSLLGNSYLNEIVLVRKITRPDLVLNELRSKVTGALNPAGSHEETMDGMDMVFCCYDFKQMELCYSAANNPVWLIRKSGALEPIETNYNKFPVGKSFDKDIPFTLYTVALKAGDSIYTFTDGYRDQFGGENGKRLGKKKFREFIMEIHNLPMKQQYELLGKRINEWKGETNEQVDDILIMGIRI